MKLNRNDLRKIMFQYNTISNRLLQADFRDYNIVLSKYIKFISDTEIIFDYISDCGDCLLNLEEEFNLVRRRNEVFPLGETDEEEVRNVFAILKFVIDNNIQIHNDVGWAYSSSNNFPNVLKAFNQRVTMVLIRHINTYLTKVGIDMGVDDKVIFNISVRDGQVNIANDSSVITATNNAGVVDQILLEKLIDCIRTEMNNSSMTKDEVDAIESSLKVIQEECKGGQPRKDFLNTAFTAMSIIKGTAEFSTAVMTLFQFLQPFFM